MSINKIRKALYTISKLLGDANAINKGKVGKRITRRVVGKQTQKGMNKLFK